jgi:glutamate synthase domain-containing protein 2
MRKKILSGVLFLVGISVVGSYLWPSFSISLFIAFPVLAVAIYDVIQTDHTILRNFPVIGHGRYILESIRPEIQQYFVELDTDETPISREERAVVYQRAKGQLDTHPFGTQRDVYEPGSEWICHSLNATTLSEPGRVWVGSSQCDQPYRSSLFNISAMSYGALSKTAVLAMNKGASMGDFYHNTGEGGISPYHLEYGADVCWQIGTGYFGARTLDGEFAPEVFAENARREAVKLIEVKLSQGAKPGHGGMLPADKVTPEIADIRKVPMGEDVISPPSHQEFSTPVEMLQFCERLRNLSDGKPIGFKLCIGRPEEAMAIAKAIRETGIYPDFLTIDGSEGGTGAGPLEFVNSVGLPLREALVYVHNTLHGAGLRDEITLMASSKIITGFDIFRTLALGADICCAARAMMLAVGCIQARRCNTNECPTGVTSQRPELYNGIDVEDKGDRVARYHGETIKSFLELLGATGQSSADEIGPNQVMQRVDETEVSSYADLYTWLDEEALLNGGAPERYQQAWSRVSPYSFTPEFSTENASLTQVGAGEPVPERR